MRTCGRRSTPSSRRPKVTARNHDRVRRSPTLETRPAVRNIEHTFMMPTGRGSASWRSRGRRRAVIAIFAVPVLFAPCATAQVNEPAKAVPEVPEVGRWADAIGTRASLEGVPRADSQAAQNYNRRRVEEATTCVKRALEILERVYPKTQFPDGHLDVSEMLGKLAMMEISAGKVREAFDRFRQSLAMTKKVARRGDPHREATLLFLAKKCSESGKLLTDVGGFEVAAQFYRLAIDAAESVDPDLPVPQGDLLLAAAWLGLTDDLRRQNKLAEEEAAWRKFIDVLNTRSRRFPDHQGEILLATAFHDLGWALTQQGRDTEATAPLQKALEIWRRLYPEKTHPKGHPEILNTLATLAHEYAEVNQLARAESSFREAVAMSRRLDPQDRQLGTLNGLPTTEGLLRGLGRVLTLGGRPVEAEACLRDSLSTARRAYPAATNPKGHAEIANALMELGRALYKLHKLDEAESIERDALAMIRRLAPLGDQRATEILCDLGSILRARGKLNEAGAILGEAFATARAQNNSAALGQVLGLAPKQKSATITRGVQSFLARITVELGRVHADRGDYAIARLYLFDARQVLATNARDKAEICDQTAAVLVLLGEKSRAQAFVGRAVAIREELYPKSDFPHGHPDLAISLAREARLMEIEGTFGFREESGKISPSSYRDTVGEEHVADRYRRALEIFQALRPEKEYPQGTVEYSDCLWMAARWHKRHGRLDQADEYGRRSLKMLECLFPQDQYSNGHPLLAARLSGLGADLGTLALHKGLTRRGEATPAGIKLGEEALGYGRRGLAMCERLFPKDEYPHGHPALAEALYNLGVIHRANWLLSPRHEWSMYQDSEAYFRRSVEVSQRLLYRILADCSEAEGLNYQSSQPPALELLALGLGPVSREFLFNAIVERKAAAARRGTAPLDSCPRRPTPRCAIWDADSKRRARSSLGCSSRRRVRARSSMRSFAKVVSPIIGSSLIRHSKPARGRSTSSREIRSSSSGGSPRGCRGTAESSLRGIGQPN